MNLKFVDYHIEHPGTWDYGSKYWLSEDYVDAKGKDKSRIIVTTNSFSEVFEKLQELRKANPDVEFRFQENDSLKKHKKEIDASLVAKFGVSLVDLLLL